MSNAAQKFKERMKAALAAGEAPEAPAEPKPAGNVSDLKAGNPALLHKRRIRREQAQARLEEIRKQDDAARQDAATQAQEGFQLLLHQLELDEKRLRELPTGEARDTMVRNELMPTWRPRVEAYLAEEEDYPNPILVLVMIWAFNIEDIAFALRCADTAVEQEQRMPERFSRNLPTFVADQVLDWAKKRELLGEDVDPHFSHVAAQLDVWGDDVPGIVHIKYLKFLAKRIEKENPKAALELYEQAFAIDPTKSKCKSALDKLRKVVAREEETNPPDGD